MHAQHSIYATSNNCREGFQANNIACSSASRFYTRIFLLKSIWYFMKWYTLSIMPLRCVQHHHRCHHRTSLIPSLSCYCFFFSWCSVHANSFVLCLFRCALPNTELFNSQIREICNSMRVTRKLQADSFSTRTHTHYWLIVLPESHRFEIFCLFWN